MIRSVFYYQSCPLQQSKSGVDVPDTRGDAVLRPHPLVDDSQDTVHVEVDNSIDHDHPAADVAVEVEIDSDNNPLQLRPHEVYHVAVVVRGVDYYHQRPETRKVVAVVDNFVVGYYNPVAGYCALVVEGIVDVVAVDGPVDFHRRVFSGGSGRFGSLTPCWAACLDDRYSRNLRSHGGLKQSDRQDSTVKMCEGGG